MIVADDGLLGVEHLAHLQRDLRLFKALGQILYIGDLCADAHDRPDIMLDAERVHNTGSQLFDIVLVDAAPDLLHKNGVALADVEHKILLLIREQAADNVVGRDIRAGRNAYEQHNAGNIGGKMHLARFGVDIPGQDVIQHDVFDKVYLIELFVVVLLDGLQAYGKQSRIARRRFVGALHHHRVIVVIVGAEQKERKISLHKRFFCGRVFADHALAHFTYTVQVGTGDHNAGFVHNTDCAIDRLLHLIDNALKHSVGHNPFFPSARCAILHQIVNLNNSPSCSSLFYTILPANATYFHKKAVDLLYKLGNTGRNPFSRRLLRP